MIVERDEMIAWLALEGWTPFKRYETINLRRGNWRTTGNPILVVEDGHLTRAKWPAEAEPVPWDELTDKRLRHIFKRLQNFTDYGRYK